MLLVTTRIRVVGDQNRNIHTSLMISLSSTVDVPSQPILNELTVAFLVDSMRHTDAPSGISKPL